jgi:hypothetical protein
LYVLITFDPNTFSLLVCEAALLTIMQRPAVLHGCEPLTPVIYDNESDYSHMFYTVLLVLSVFSATYATDARSEHRAFIDLD